ncbi:MAG: MerR family DNA-binding transcriptional regulator [Candidatus Limnocylindrales bacterium]
MPAGPSNRQRLNACRASACSPAPRLAYPLDLRPDSKVKAGRMTAMRISEVARRSGIPTTTLRYYEGVGLVPCKTVRSRPAAMRR